MNEKQSWPSDDWFAALAEGDPDVVSEFWQSYGAPLRRVAERQISQSLGKRVDADDVVQSACRTFFRRFGQGEFEFHNQSDLWRLLLTITLNKVRIQARYHGRQCRGLSKEQVLDADAPIARGMVNEMEQIDFADFLESVFLQFDDESRQLLQRMLDGQTQNEIGLAMGISERTVRRMRGRIQDRLQTMLTGPDADE